MARGFRLLATSVTRLVEVEDILEARGLIRPHPKPAPGASQAFTLLIGVHPGGVVRSRQRGHLECKYSRI